MISKSSDTNAFKELDKAMLDSLGDSLGSASGTTSGSSPAPLERSWCLACKAHDLRIVRANAQ